MQQSLYERKGGSGCRDICAMFCLIGAESFEAFLQEDLVLFGEIEKCRRRYAYHQLVLDGVGHAIFLDCLHLYLVMPSQSATPRCFFRLSARKKGATVPPPSRSAAGRSSPPARRFPPPGPSRTVSNHRRRSWPPPRPCSRPASGARGRRSPVTGPSRPPTRMLLKPAWAIVRASQSMTSCASRPKLVRPGLEAAFGHLQHAEGRRAAGPLDAAHVHERREPADIGQAQLKLGRKRRCKRDLGRGGACPQNQGQEGVSRRAQMV
jgi:hypothetical protein